MREGLDGDPPRAGDNRQVDGPRPCQPAELPALTAAANQVFRPGGGDMARDYPLLFAGSNLENLMLVRDTDGVVAHAGLCLRRASVHGTTITVAALGAVFTRQAQRGRGLGAAVVGAALDRARAAGATLALVSGDGPLYRRLGFAPAPAATAWACPAPPAAESAEEAAAIAATAAAGDECDLRLAGEDDIPLLARIHEAEPVRFARDAADWQALLRASMVFAWPGQVWIDTFAVAPAGYLAVARSARRRVLELAGDRDALLAAAPRVADDIVVPAHDTETARDLEALAWENRAFTLPAGHQWLQSPSPPLPIPWYGLNYV
jgi:predicted N-acetyltransferase YhbS